MGPAGFSEAVTVAHDVPLSKAGSNPLPLQMGPCYIDCNFLILNLRNNKAQFFGFFSPYHLLNPAAQTLNPKYCSSFHSLAPSQNAANIRLTGPRGCFSAARQVPFTDGRLWPVERARYVLNWGNYMHELF